MTSSLLALAAAAALAAPQEASMQTEWSGASCAATSVSQRVASSRSDWRSIWKVIGKPPPRVDMKRYAAAAVFLGEKPTGGYGVRWEGPDIHGDDVILRWRETSPGGAMVLQALTRPFAVRLLPKPKGRLILEKVP